VHAHLKHALALLILIPLTAIPTLTLAQTPQPQPLWTIIHPTDNPSISTIEWSPDGAQLIVVYNDKYYNVYTAQGDPHWDDLTGGTVTGVAWSPNSLYLAIAGYDLVILYDRWGTELAYWTWSDYPGYPVVYGVDWSPDSTMLAWHGTPRLAVATYDFETIMEKAYTEDPYNLLAVEPDVLWVFDDENVFFYGIDWYPQDKILAYGSLKIETRWGTYQNATIIVFNPDGTQAWNHTNPKIDKITSASWNPTTGQIAYDVETVQASHVAVLSPEGTLQWESPDGPGQVTHYWSPDGQKLLIVRVYYDDNYIPNLQVEVYTNDGTLQGTYGPVKGELADRWGTPSPLHAWNAQSSLAAIAYTPVIVPDPEAPYNYEVLNTTLLILDEKANPVWEGPIITNDTIPEPYEVNAATLTIGRPVHAWHPQATALATAYGAEVASSPTAPWEPSLIIQLLTLDGQPINIRVPPQPEYQTTTTTTTEPPLTTPAEAANTLTTSTITGGTTDAQAGFEGGSGLPVSTAIIVVVVIVVVVVGVARKFLRVL